MKVCFVYRYKDVTSQVGWPSYIVQTGGYLLSLMVGMIVAYEAPGDRTTSGFLVGFFLWVLSIAISTLIAKTPTVMIYDNVWANKFYMTTLYQGDQLRKVSESSQLTPRILMLSSLLEESGRSHSCGR
jgi:solute carrier family 6 GABA transporter-like protein 1